MDKLAELRARTAAAASAWPKRKKAEFSQAAYYRDKVRPKALAGLTEEQARVSDSILRSLGRNNRKRPRVEIHSYPDGPSPWTWADVVNAMPFIPVPFGKKKGA